MQAHSTPRVARHCHTGVSTQHTDLALSHRCVYPTHRLGTVTPVCLPNTPTWHCHTGVSTQHTDLALSHRCVYPTHRLRTVTPACLPNTPTCTVTPVSLPNTPTWHCHTGVSTQHTGPALSHRCLPNTPAWQCHTGVSTQHTGLAMSHRRVYPTHRTGNVTPVSTQHTYFTSKAINVFTQLLHVSTPPVIRLITKGKYEQLYIITTLVSRSGRNMCQFHKNKICLDRRSSGMLCRVDW